MASDKILTLTDATFDESVRQGVTLVDFWAAWCAPCRRIAPTIDALAEHYDGRVKVAKMNVDDNPAIPSRYAIRSIPTLLLIKDGEVRETVVGLASKDDLVAMIDRHL